MLEVAVGAEQLYSGALQEGPSPGSQASMAVTSGSRGQGADDSVADHLVCAGIEGCVCQAVAETSLP